MKIHVGETQCRGCEACLLACSLLHEGESNPALARLRVQKDMTRYTFHLVFCRHCDQADCVAACPTAAIQVDGRGAVRIDQDACMVCGACAEACESGAIFFNEALGQYYKCDLCPDLAAPACVTICPVSAIVLAEAL